MTFDEIVTHIIYYHYESYPIAIEDVVESLHAKQDTILFSSSMASHGLTQFHSNFLLRVAQGF